MPTNRETVRARQSVGHIIAEVFLPLERAADQTAIAAHRCVATLLEQRIVAAFGVTAGQAAIDAIEEGRGHAYAAQASFRRAHEMFPDLMTELGITDYAPECPLSEKGEPVRLKIAS